MKNIPGYTGSVRYGGFRALFPLNGHETEYHNRLFLQKRNDQIGVTLARSKSLATHVSFTDYTGNCKQILKIMEDKEDKRVLNECTDVRPDDSRRPLLDPPSEPPSEEK